MRSLRLHKSLAKDLDTPPPKQYRQVVSSMLDLLNDPPPHYSTPLVGDTVLVAACGKRNDCQVYRVHG